MIIAIDDSGDPGLKIGKGSSRYFVIAVVCFADDLDAEEASLKIKRIRRDLKWKPLHEFKFRKTSPEIRRMFLSEMKRFDFRVSLVILDKTDIINIVAFKKNASELYNAAILKALASFSGRMESVHIYIDGESGLDYRRKVRTYLRKNLPKGAIKELTYRDSKNDNLIQLADMIAGATRRSVERDTDASYLKIIKERITRIEKTIY
ncbi:DUF3800 domain-containing protein [Candidatus Saccharibacteria bacterium]|nr:DUF3800 domain-containing protein [Candidatus Saccharibacteria bacterium]